MATLYVTEYQHAAVDQGRALPVGQGAPLATQNIAITGGSLSSNAFNALTHLIRVHCDVICSIRITNPPGPAVAAATTDSRMAANQTEYFGVFTGGFISVISNT